MKAFLVYVGLAALTLAVFGLWPDLDIAVAHIFYDGGGFIGRDGLDRFGRDFFRITPFVALAGYAALWLASRAGRWRGWAPSGRAMIFLIATIAIGPGVVVNLSLKDHWHRPRPYQTQDFSGKSEFKPWYDDEGACKKNCSFVSGEAATGFWMVAPASVLPPPGPRAGDPRRLRVRDWREPAADGVRRPLPLRRAAGRAGDADHHRDRSDADLAARGRPFRTERGPSRRPDSGGGRGERRAKRRRNTAATPPDPRTGKPLA